MYIDHVFYGKAHGRMAEIVQMHFTETLTNKKDDTHYLKRAVLGIYNFDRPFTGTTVLFKDSVLKSMYYKTKKEFQKVRLEWGAFEQVFDVYSTCQTEARLVMETDFMEGVYDFYKEFPEMDISLTFYEGKMMVLLEDKSESVGNETLFDYHPSTKNFYMLKKLCDDILFIVQLPQAMKFKGFQKEYEFADDEKN